MIALEECTIVSGKLGNGSKVVVNVWSRDGVGYVNYEGVTGRRRVVALSSGFRGGFAIEVDSEGTAVGDGSRGADGCESTACRSLHVW